MKPSSFNGQLEAQGTATFNGAPSFPLRHRLLRALWTLTWTLFAAWTPPPFHRWRIFLVNLFGGRVHPKCSIYGSVRIWYPPNLTMERGAALGPGVQCYCMAPVVLRAFAVVSQRAFLCTGTHNIYSPEFQIAARAIEIGENSWVAAEAFVGPGVIVGPGAVLAARAAAFQRLEAWGVYRGNPALRVKARPKFTR